MRRLLFALTLAVYGFSAMEVHEWLRVPQVVMHFLEHHTSEAFHDLLHQEHDTATAHDEHAHDPFATECHGEFCACGGLVALGPAPPVQLISVTAPCTTLLGTAFLSSTPSGFSGNVWNPPKA